MLHNGKSIFFWLDVWCGDIPLCVRFSALFAICDKPNAKVVNLWLNKRWQPGFRRSLGPPEIREWEELRSTLRTVQPTCGRDEVSWKLEASGCFSSHSLYKEIFKVSNPCDLKGLWKIRLPSKIKIFLWQAARNRITSGDQVQKRHGPGDGKCVWCGEIEDRDHLLFRCIVARFMWSAIREITGGACNPSGLTDVLRLIQGTKGSDRQLAWMGFGAMACALWITRNKALIEGIFFPPSS